MLGLDENSKVGISEGFPEVRQGRGALLSNSIQTSRDLMVNTMADAGDEPVKGIIFDEKARYGMLRRRGIRRSLSDGGVEW
jgi:hypothetical protein